MGRPPSVRATRRALSRARAPSHVHTRTRSRTRSRDRQALANAWCAVETSGARGTFVRTPLPKRQKCQIREPTRLRCVDASIWDRWTRDTVPVPATATTTTLHVWHHHPTAPPASSSSSPSIQSIPHTSTESPHDRRTLALYEAWYHLNRHRCPAAEHLVQDAARALKGIPGHLVQGAEDRVCPPAQAQRLYRALDPRDTRLTMVPMAGHRLKDRVFAEAVREGVRDVVRRVTE